MTFIENKYTKIYYKIIYSALNRPNILSYSENHHIVPKSLGGCNKKDNLVRLTAREHFICHILLVKMTFGNNKKKMIHAAIGMKRSRNYQNRYVNSRLYESIKKEFAEISRERNTGKKHSEETRKKMSLAGLGKPKSETHAKNISLALTGKKRKPMSEETKEKLSEINKGRTSPNLGNTGRYKHSEEQKQKISENNKKRGCSEETKKRISDGVKLANEKRIVKSK